MKKRSSFLLVLFLCILCFAVAEADTESGFTYSVQAEITDFTASVTELVIPDTLGGVPVTGIADGAFRSMKCQSIESVTIPDSVVHIGENPFIGPVTPKLSVIRVSAGHPYLAVTDNVLFSKPDRRLICYPAGLGGTSYAIPEGTREIADNAFYGNTVLERIEIPDSVTVIGGMAFDSCEALTSITLPDHISAIGRNPFRTCPRLTAINVSPDHPYLQKIGEVLFVRPEKRLLCYPCTLKAQAYSVPEGTLEIGEMAFFGCGNLAEVSIPERVASIGAYAFYNCPSLASVSIPASVTDIGGDAFGRCGNLTLLVTPGSRAEQYCRENSLAYDYAGKSIQTNTNSEGMN